MTLNIYMTHGGKNKRISQAFAKGTGFPIVSPTPLLPGDVFMYGALRGLMPTLLQAQAEGRTWFYADNGYFRPSKDRHHKVDGYFRVTRNALQHDGSGTFGPERWLKLDLEIKPWRTNGSHIVVCPPGKLFGEIWGMDPEAWLTGVRADLKQYTDRPVRVRRKPADGAPSLPDDLNGAWALIAWSSNSAVEALRAGIPVFCSAPCAAYRMGTPDLARIEAPVMPDDREQWAWNLAANQWTIEEMRNGACWRELNARNVTDEENENGDYQRFKRWAREAVDE